MRPNFKVYQDMWFLWETWFQGIPRMCGFYGTPGFKVYQDMWFYGFMGHLVARKISFPRFPLV